MSDCHAHDRPGVSTSRSRKANRLRACANIEGIAPPPSGASEPVAQAALAIDDFVDVHNANHLPFHSTAKRYASPVRHLDGDRRTTAGFLPIRRERCHAQQCGLPRNPIKSRLLVETSSVARRAVPFSTNKEQSLSYPSILRHPGVVFPPRAPSLESHVFPAKSCIAETRYSPEQVAARKPPSH